MLTISNLDNFQSIIISFCKNKCDKSWVKRKRIASTLNILSTLCALVTGNNSRGLPECLLKSANTMTPSGFCRARKKLMWQSIRTLFQLVLKQFNLLTTKKFLWNGHRVFTVDGTRIALPLSFKKIKYKAKGLSFYPYGTLSVLYQLKCEIPYDLILARHGDERLLASHHLNRLKQEDVVVYDRGYFSFKGLAQHLDSHIHAVFRLSKKAFKQASEFYTNSERDKIVTIMFKDKPYSIRLVKYTIGSKKYILGTTLLDASYTVLKLKSLYHKRWGIEEFFKKVKQTYQIEEFHSKNSNGIHQELWTMMFCNLITKIFEYVTNSKPNKNRSPRKVKKYNQKAMTYILNDMILPLILRDFKIVQSTALKAVLVSIKRLEYNCYPGRVFPRFSKKIESKWRKRTKKAFTAKSLGKSISSA